MLQAHAAFLPATLKQQQHAPAAGASPNKSPTRCPKSVRTCETAHASDSQRSLRQAASSCDLYPVLRTLHKLPPVSFTIPCARDAAVMAVSAAAAAAGRTHTLAVAAAALPWKEVEEAEGRPAACDGALREQAGDATHITPRQRAR